MHVVSGLIRKAPFVKQGCGQDGQSTMYAVELSEVIKGWNGGETTYTNYKALMFAKTSKAIEFYNKAFSEGSFVVLACENLKVESREHNGQTYVALMMENAQLRGANFPETAQGWGQPQQPNNGQPYQQSQQNPKNDPPF